MKNEQHEKLLTRKKGCEGTITDIFIGSVVHYIIALSTMKGNQGGKVVIHLIRIVQPAPFDKEVLRLDVKVWQTEQPLSASKRGKIRSERPGYRAAHSDGRFEGHWLSVDPAKFVQAASIPYLPDEENKQRDALY